MADHLAIATIIIYAILLQPTLYCFWAHGKHGFLGWFYLQIFCLLRIIGNAVEVANPKNTHTQLINNIGLSPLLLATAGILHEARRARNCQFRSKIEWFLVIQYHALVSVALGLIIAGIIPLENGKVSSGTKTLLKLGAALLVLCWVLLLVWTAISVQPHQKDTNGTIYRHGWKLLFGVIVALPLVALRLAYGVGSLILELKGPSSEFTTSLAVKVCLSVVPEMLLMTTLVALGVITRNIWAPSGRWKQTNGYEKNQEGHRLELLHS